MIMLIDQHLPPTAIALIIITLKDEPPYSVEIQELLVLILAASPWASEFVSLDLGCWNKKKAGLCYVALGSDLAMSRNAYQVNKFQISSLKLNSQC